MILKSILIQILVAVLVAMQAVSAHNDEPNYSNEPTISKHYSNDHPTTFSTYTSKGHHSSEDCPTSISKSYSNETSISKSYSKHHPTSISKSYSEDHPTSISKSYSENHPTTTRPNHYSEEHPKTISKSYSKGHTKDLPSPSKSTDSSPTHPGAIPDNVQKLYEKIRSTDKCSKDIKAPFFALDDSPKDFCYCDEFMDGKGFYIRGTGHNLVGMQVDCDGDQEGLTKRCGNSKDTQSQTSFKPDVQAFGISDLRADIHPYVVLGNEGSAPGYTTFDPRSVGVEPLSIVAVVCNGKMIFGIWGDTNGDDGLPLVGEASIAVATACFGDKMDGNHGHDEFDVLYIAFSGHDAVPKDTAKWDASSYEEFEDSIIDLGNKLVATL